MKQGIIFGVIITCVSFILVSYLKENVVVDLTQAEVVLVQNGEEIYSSPFLRKGQQVIWYINDDGNKMVLKDQEIIDYYDLNIKEKDLLDIKKIDMNKVYNKSKKSSEINMILNTNGYVEVLEANCPNKKDVKMGKIYDSSKVIICVPHKLVIKIRGIKGSGNIDA